MTRVKKIINNQNPPLAWLSKVHRLWHFFPSNTYEKNINDRKNQYLNKEWGTSLEEINLKLQFIFLVICLYRSSSPSKDLLSKTLADIDTPALWFIQRIFDNTDKFLSLSCSSVMQVQCRERGFVHWILRNVEHFKHKHKYSNTRKKKHKIEFLLIFYFNITSNCSM